MSKHWKKIADSKIHMDFMDTSWVGGIPISFEGKLTKQCVFFVRECSFTFQFISLEQIETMISHFEQKTHPSERDFNGLEHYWQKWYERLPSNLLKESKRTRILKALKKALKEFKSDTD